MSIAATLSDDLVEAAPGDAATVVVRVLNDGDLVDELVLDVLGEPRGWARVEPERLFLLPGESGTAMVVFAPPRSAAVPAGVRRFGVRARSHGDPEAVAVEEGTAVVAPFADVAVAVRPRVRRRRGRAAYLVEVDNEGNAQADVALAGRDDEDALRYAFAAERLVVPPGTRAAVRLRVRPRGRVPTGPPRPRTFTVEAWHAGAEQPATAGAAYVQRAVVPSWAVRTAVLLVVLGGLLAAYAARSGGLPPPPETSARVSTASEEAAAENARTAQRAAAAAQQQAAVAARELARLKEAAASPPPGPTTTPYGSSMTVPAPRVPGRTGTVAFVWPERTALALTDLVVMGRAGDTVDVRVRRGRELLLQLRVDSPEPRALTFATPVVFAASGALTVEVACVATTAAAAPPQCVPVVYAGGFLKAAR